MVASGLLVGVDYLKGTFLAYPSTASTATVRLPVDDKDLESGPVGL